MTTKLAYLRQKFMHLMGGGDVHKYESEYGKRLDLANNELNEAIEMKMGDLRREYGGED